MKPFIIPVLALTLITLLTGFNGPTAHADRWEVRQEVREGYREVNRAKRDAARNVLRCDSRQCARREVNRGYRDVAREKREARREIKHAIRHDRYERRRDNRRDILGTIVVGGAIIGIANALSDN